VFAEGEGQPSYAEVVARGSPKHAAAAKELPEVSVVLRHMPQHDMHTQVFACTHAVHARQRHTPPPL